MADRIINVQGISKAYSLDVTSKYSFKETISEGIKTLVKGKRRDRKEDILWALKDINFELNKGEVLGIIGKNGAGKSTLLKIISEITYPTEGEITFFGKVTSVLEIGTGFVPELTGRQNIFLNGALLGMSKKDISLNIKQIIVFSELGDFVDTPVKYYSSGMYIRLAFSIAVHLDADILVLDEVLSVGDESFRRKSLNRIREIVKSGITIILASHDMGSVANLCTKCMLLEKGRVQAFDTPDKLTSQYVENAIFESLYNAQKEDKQDKLSEEEETTIDLEDKLVDNEEDEDLWEVQQRKKLEKIEELKNRKLIFREWKDLQKAPGDERFKIKKLSIKPSKKDFGSDIYTEDEICLEIDYFKQTSSNTVVVFILRGHLNNPIFPLSPVIAQKLTSVDDSQPGHYQARCYIPNNILNKGFFIIDVHIPDVDDNYRDIILLDPALAFRVLRSEAEEKRIGPASNFVGPILMDWRWETLRSTE